MRQDPRNEETFLPTFPYYVSFNNYLQVGADWNGCKKRRKEEGRPIVLLVRHDETPSEQFHIIPYIMHTVLLLCSMHSKSICGLPPLICATSDVIRRLRTYELKDCYYNTKIVRLVRHDYLRDPSLNSFT